MEEKLGGGGGGNVIKGCRQERIWGGDLPPPPSSSLPLCVALSIIKIYRSTFRIIIFFPFSDLSSHQELAAAILDCFSSPSEEVKSAASFALGLIYCVYVNFI